MKYAYVWKYIVKQASQEAFEAAYGPEGGWVQLFRRAEGYLRTELLRNQAKPLEYMTVDFWESKAASDAFRLQFAEAFAALDQQCESLTEAEDFIGNVTGFSD